MTELKIGMHSNEMSAEGLTCFCILHSAFFILH